MTKINEIDFFTGIPDNQLFIDCCKKYLQPFLEEFGYSEVEISNEECDLKIVYENTILAKKILVENHYNHTDYGFSIFIHFKDEYNILAHIPWNKEDREGYFLKYFILLIMSNKELVSIIKTNKWVKFNRIYYNIFEDDLLQ